jgi:hypothetical protein
MFNYSNFDTNAIYYLLFFILGFLVSKFNIYEILTNPKVYDSLLFKFILFLIILYTANNVSICLAILISIVLLFIYQRILKNKIKENFENNEFLENPLMKSKDLKLFDDSCLKLITSNEISEILIEKGKNLLNISQEMRNKNNDDREKEIIIEIENKGKNLITTGINMVENNNV